MGIGRLLQRVERVLQLAERLLTERLPERVDTAFFERHRAFRWDAGLGPGHLVPIDRPAAFDLDDLIGVSDAIAALDRNTRQLLAGLPCNNVLLYGERATGKSSAVKGLLARYADRGLRLIEVQKSDLVHLPRVLAALRGGAASHRFVIFCDDLSFGPCEEGFRELKAALEGGLESPPANVCIVVTSNRRHLLPETMAENRAASLDGEGELHMAEALEEKLALADRFGLVLGFYAFDQATYLRIVGHYLKRAGVPGVEADRLDERLRREALRWALARGSRSGRTARQFAIDVAGRRALSAAVETTDAESGSDRTLR